MTGTGSDSRYATPESALAAVHADITDAQDRAAVAQQWAQESMALTGSGTSEAGAVRVQIDVNGQVTGLRISDAVARQGGKTVRYAVLDAFRAAQENLRSSADAVTRRHYDDSDPAARMFRAEVRANTVPPVVADPGRERQEGGTW